MRVFRALIAGASTGPTCAYAARSGHTGPPERVLGNVCSYSLRLVEVAELLERARPVAPAAQRALPVCPALTPLLPTGLPRGSTVGAGLPRGDLYLLLAALAGPSGAGSWCAVVGLPGLGVEAAAAMGVDLERLALVPYPGERWPTVVATLLDGMDVVALGVSRAVRTGDARRLSARARNRGSVLVVAGDWPESPDLVLNAGPGTWEGLGHGHGHLLRRRVEVEVGGRRAGRPRRGELWLPSAGGGVEAVEQLNVRRLVPA